MPRERVHGVRARVRRPRSRFPLQRMFSTASRRARARWERRRSIERPSPSALMSDTFPRPTLRAKKGAADGRMDDAARRVAVIAKLTAARPHATGDDVNGARGRFVHDHTMRFTSCVRRSSARRTHASANPRAHEAAKLFNKSIRNARTCRCLSRRFRLTASLSTCGRPREVDGRLPSAPTRARKESDTRTLARARETTRAVTHLRARVIVDEELEDDARLTETFRSLFSASWCTLELRADGRARVRQQSMIYSLFGGARVYAIAAASVAFLGTYPDDPPLFGTA